eukprot:TRINITY_DN996_c0_g1_i1.p1 TRINITY_DN996_c0_g1~~TRINITY_DN996_c0_g1_i1.p1  ORF type:complete len:299 (-),score=79.36 TRINITY_DN996_c0_g1_i1:901-1674(-)
MPESDDDLWVWVERYDNYFSKGFVPLGCLLVMTEEEEKALPPRRLGDDHRAQQAPMPSKNIMLSPAPASFGTKPSSGGGGGPLSSMLAKTGVWQDSLFGRDSTASLDVVTPRERLRSHTRYASTVSGDDLNQQRTRRDESFLRKSTVSVQTASSGSDSGKAPLVAGGTAYLAPGPPGQLGVSNSDDTRRPSTLSEWSADSKFSSVSIEQSPTINPQQLGSALYLSPLSSSVATPTTPFKEIVQAMESSQTAIQSLPV